MIIKNTIQPDLQTAINRANVFFDDNLEFAKLEQINHGGYTPHYRVTLKVQDASKAGARRGWQLNKDGTRRKIAKACWHAHREFFRQLAIVTNRSGQSVYVETTMGGTKSRFRLQTNRDHYDDWSVGNSYSRSMMSDMCECKKEGIADG